MTPVFSLRILKKAQKKEPFSIAVSKKVSKKAVLRNLVKRRVRAVVRARKAFLLPDRFFLFSARPGAAELPFPELERQIVFLLKQGMIAS